jgi:hypothetical protein
MTRRPFDWRGMKLLLLGVGVVFSGFGLSVLGVRAAEGPLFLIGLRWRSSVWTQTGAGRRLTDMASGGGSDITEACLADRREIGQSPVSITQNVFNW